MLSDLPFTVNVIGSGYSIREGATIIQELAAQPDYYEVLVELGVSEFIEASADEYTGSEAMLKPFYGYGDDSAPSG